MKRKELQNYAVIMFIAFCFLAICSRSSFIYPCNNWDDSNSYFTMGKVMMNGGVIYRDAFDQKGPLLYFIYGLGYLMSNTTFFGVFVLEIVALAVTLLAEYKLLRLYVSHTISMLMLPIGAMAITASKSFYWGGSAEEFCLPLLAWGLYYSVKYFKEVYPKQMSWKYVLLFGCLAGCIMLIKFTLLGLYFAWMAMIAVANLNSKNWKSSIRNCLVFLGGMALPVIPWLLYFGINHALDDWYHAYIYCNVFLYSDIYEGSMFSLNKIYILAKILYWLVWDNFVYFAFIILGFLGILFHKKFRWYEKINVYMLFGFLFLGIYIGGTSLFYYSLPLAIFSVFGLLMIGEIVEWTLSQFYIEDIFRKFLGVFIIVGYIGVMVFTWNMSMNTEFSRQKKEDFYLYKFREVVLQEENPTLLNISCLDAGLYTLADIMPNCRYFQSNAVHGFDEVREEQMRYIREKKVDFILARDFYPEEIGQYYELIMEEKYGYREQDFVYYLFKRK